ncbi:MAG: LamG domain-containing protein, partial [bacterium]
QTLGGTIVTPEALAGNSAWTVSADLYRADMGWNGDSAYLSLAGWWNGGNQCDEFCYVNNKAVDHGYSGWGFSTVPSAGAWHNVTITYDGTTEKIYVDGVLDGSRDIALNIAAGDQIIIGSHSDVPGPDRLWNDNYWRYSGAIAKLLIFDGALTADEIDALLKGPPQGTVMLIR